MKGINSWNFNPYRPLIGYDEPIYISRIAPDVDSASISWFNINNDYSVYMVKYRKYNSNDPYDAIITIKTNIKIENLCEDADYEFYIENKEGRSRQRIFRTGYVPGVVVNYLHPDDEYYKFSGRYLCSPSLVKLPDGTLLASMDVFESGASQNLTLIFKSEDKGETWTHHTELFPCFWGKLFVHRGVLYMLAMSTEYGDLLIGSSYDGGKNFSMPTVIMRGSGQTKAAGFHKAPMPVIAYAGRLWTAVDYGSWGTGTHASCLLSIGEDDDLLVSGNWSLTPPLPYNQNWSGAVKGRSSGCLEGNAVVSTNGDIFNILRYQTNGCEPSYGKAMVLKGDISNPEKQLTYDKVINFTGNLSKFDIIYDEKSGYYLSIITGDFKAQGRNLLSLAASKNLYDWEIKKTLLDYTAFDPKQVGFQYISFMTDGDDILYLSRTALNGANNFHDANYSTFHKIENYRTFL